MTLRRTTARRSRRAGAPNGNEWVGGVFTSPFFVDDHSEPYRPDFVLWLELPEGLIVGQGLVAPGEGDGAVARTLRAAVAQPAVGPPRRPDAIRVANASIVDEVRAETAGDIPVTVAPTPELDDLFEELCEAMEADDRDIEGSYLAEGRVPAVAVEALFSAGNALYALEPWALGDEPPILRLDIPALGVDGACVSIIGQLGEVHGILIFPSLDDFYAFLDASKARAYEDGFLGSDVLSLTFESVAALPRSMRREAMEHGWRAHSANAYPLVQRRDPDSVSRPLAARDVEIATACAQALTAFLGKHAAILSAETFAPVRVSHFDDKEREVVLSAACDRLPDFEPAGSENEEFVGDEFVDRIAWALPNEPFRPRAGRNEPCPCGSGRKYKKCHLRTDEAEHAEGRRATATHEMDARLLGDLRNFATREFGEEWRRFQDDLATESDSIFLTYPLSVFSFEANGTTVVDAYLTAHGRRCTAAERDWLEAQRAAWLSVWEVEAVEAGRSLTLRDLLSGERRTVLERSASKIVVVRDALLARVVDYDGLSLLAGIHSGVLNPFEAHDVVDRARRRLRRKRDVPVERLRDAAFGRALIRYWIDALEELRIRRSLPRELRNRDGDLLTQTVDRFEVLPGTMTEIGRIIAQLEGFIEEGAEDGAATYVFLGAYDGTLPEGQRTVLGITRLEPTALRTETNSEARADALRERLEAACGARIRHRAREQTNPFAFGSAVGEAPSLPAPSPEDERFAAEHKARHYAEWPDLPLPALGQETPREFARTAAGRREVDLLLKHMENMEQRAGGAAPFDFSIIRDELGIAPR